MDAEVIQFVGALVFLVCVLVGSYWFVYAPVKRQNDRDIERRRQRQQQSQ